MLFELTQTVILLFIGSAFMGAYRSVNSLVIVLFVVLTPTITTLCDGQFMVEVLEKVFAGYHVVLRCDATGADFGADASSFGYGINATGCAYFTYPETACDDNVVPRTNSTLCINRFAVVPRGNCTFSEKAYHVQMAHPETFNALIVYNNPGHPPVPMAGKDYADLVKIPVVMVSHQCMENMMGSYSAENGYVVAIRAIPGYYDLVKYLIPFVAVVGLCFVVLFISLFIRVCRERRRLARKRLSRRNLKKLPTKKYQKGDQPETCAICLDDFVEGEKIRILPCKHAYHCKCIDPWLTKTRKVCPICKRKVLSTGDSDSSDSDTERRNADAAASSGLTTRENAPLLDNEQPMAPPIAEIHNISHSNYDEEVIVDRSNRGDISRPSSSRSMQTTTAVVHDDGMQNGVTSRDGQFSAGERPNLFRRSASDISVALRQKIRPFVRGLVSKATRNSRREPEFQTPISQIDSATLENERNFAAENSAFDDSSESRLHEPRPQVKFISSMSSDEDEAPSASGVTRTEQANKRRRHPAASGKFTQAELDLNEELPSNEQLSSSDLDSKESCVTGGHSIHTHKNFPRKRGTVQSSQSMPHDLPAAPFEKRTTDASTISQLEGSSVTSPAPSDYPKPSEDGVFKASFDLDDEFTRDKAKWSANSHDDGDNL